MRIKPTIGQLKPTFTYRYVNTDSTTETRIMTSRRIGRTFMISLLGMRGIGPSMGILRPGLRNFLKAGWEIDVNRTVS
jgi:hypothetical protein